MGAVRTDYDYKQALERCRRLHGASLERVAVLERALEKICAGTQGWTIGTDADLAPDHVYEIAREALDG